MTRSEVKDYNKVKAANLYHLELSPKSYRQKFWAWKKGEDLQAQLLAQSLQDLVECWLHPEEKTVGKVIDMILLKQFLADLGEAPSSGLRDTNPG